MVAVAGALAAGAVGRKGDGSRAGRSPTSAVTSASAPKVGAPLTSQPASTVPTRAATARPGAIPALSSIAGPAHAAAPTVASAPPVRVQIPSIGVDSALQPLHLTAGGVLQTPSRYPVAGWYAGGVRPGDVGPAVIAGHVDSVSGPAVFFRLRSLRPGAAVVITRADHSTVHFTVASTAQFPKNRFPTQAVYGPAPVPTLRLITCSGDFDRTKLSYVDNLVVTAYL